MPSDVEMRREKDLGAPPEAGSYMMAHNSTWRWPSSVVYTVCSYPTLIGSVQLVEKMSERGVP